MDVSFQRSYFIVGEVFGLPNIKSAKKRVLVSEARNARNKANRSALKTAIKKFEAAAVEGNRTEAEGAYKVAVKSIDKAAAKGLLHKNNAAQEECADAETQPDWLIQTKGHLPGVLFFARPPESAANRGKDKTERNFSKKNYALLLVKCPFAAYL